MKYPSDHEIVLSQLQAERKYLKTDRDLYLKCMNGKPLIERFTPQEVRDGLLLYWHVYRYIVDNRNKSDTI